MQAGMYCMTEASIDARVVVRMRIQSQGGSTGVTPVSRSLSVAADIIEGWMSSSGRFGP